ncbi:hypothetical protein ACROYT_G015593 [Oculina patagonica]
MYTGTESLILADVVASLGHKLVKDERLSSVSCLTCARTLTRIHGTFVKLVSQSNDGIQVTSNSKRLSSSPTGISPSAKRSCENAAANRTPARCRRSLDLRDVPSSSNISKKENLDPIDVAANRTPQSRRSLDLIDVANSLADRMESEMNLSNADSQESIMKQVRVQRQQFQIPRGQNLYSESNLKVSNVEEKAALLYEVMRKNLEHNGKDFKGPEDYSTLSDGLKNVIDAVNTLIDDGCLYIDGKRVNLHFHLGDNYKERDIFARMGLLEMDGVEKIIIQENEDRIRRLEKKKTEQIKKHRVTFKKKLQEEQKKRFLIKAGATDMKAGLRESMRGEWPEDCDLRDRKLLMCMMQLFRGLKMSLTIDSLRASQKAFLRFKQYLDPRHLCPGSEEATSKRYNLDQLKSAGLGKKRIAFNKNGDHAYFIKKLEEEFPQLQTRHGAIEVLKSTGGGAGIQPITPIPMGS